MREMKKSNLKFKNNVIKHLRKKQYNVNQHKKGKQTYTVYPPEGTWFVLMFKQKHLMVANSFELNNKNRKKLLEFTNDLNSQSKRFKFSLEEDNILVMDTKLQNIYYKREFNMVLENINHDMNELFIDQELYNKML